MQVYVLLFNAGTDNEGIHSLQANGRNTVLMFEDEDDATRFGLMLEAQDFPTPDVEAFEQGEIEEFCEEAGFDLKLIPAGSLMMPPENTVESTDWDIDGNYGEEVPPTADESRLSNEELDDIRQRLEKLL
ncbi:MAG: DUF3110 domain-containing protein [Leptolyngbya sp. SIOISBB]|nr:DUF3110 domain-containing protein [Leptolyngbya sp. SIOISBB]